MKPKEAEQAIQDLLDGTLGEAAFARVEERLRTDPEFRKLYLSYVKSHHLLIEKFENSDGKIIPMTVSPWFARRRRIILALVACVAVLVSVATLFQVSRPEPGAALVFGPESAGRTVHGNGKTGDDVMWVGSSLELARGSVSIVMPNGVKGYFEGPGKLEMESLNRLRLRQGRVWFEVPEGAEGFVCVTDSLFVEDLGTEFGVYAEPGRPEEVHVIEGQVRLHPIKRPQEERLLNRGEGSAWKDEQLEPTDGPAAFSAAFPQKITVFSDNFDDPDGTPLNGKASDIGAGPWEVSRGAMKVRNGILDTRGDVRNMAFAPLALPRLNDLTHILLMTLEAEGPGGEGWAGVSLYTGDQERIFVGDPCGDSGDWALHPVGWQAITACPLLAGKTTVTLRYNYRTGLAELFEGAQTTGTPLASQWIAPGLAFDRVRIANGSTTDAILDAGGTTAEAMLYDETNTRSNIAVRSIKVSVLSAENTIRESK